MRKISHIYPLVISVDNLLFAWQEFVTGKSDKRDVLSFQENLMDNIFVLHKELLNHTYQHGNYHAFKIFDPKPRDIHKAKVRDRLLHHAIYRILYPLYDKKFIFDSYSCRNKKGTHRSINRLKKYVYKVSRNNTKTCYCLKLDIRKFFASVDQKTLINILEKSIDDRELIWLLKEIIFSFKSTNDYIGLPLGNLTSQLFVNIYMDKFDQFIKHRLKIKYYLRYADDFIILNQNRQKLENIIPLINIFLKENLKLTIHPDKIYIRTINSGLDFLGIINFYDHRILRTKTKKRLFKRINDENKDSYFGMLKHCNSHKIFSKIQIK